MGNSLTQIYWCKHKHSGSPKGFNNTYTYRYTYTYTYVPKHRHTENCGNCMWNISLCGLRLFSFSFFFYYLYIKSQPDIAISISFFYSQSYNFCHIYDCRCLGYQQSFCSKRDENSNWKRAAYHWNSCGQKLIYNAITTVDGYFYLCSSSISFASFFFFNVRLCVFAMRFSK